MSKVDVSTKSEELSEASENSNVVKENVEIVESSESVPEDSTRGYLVGVKVKFQDPFAIDEVGFKRGEIYESCVGTDDEQKDHLWFMSPKYNEPVMMYPYEYIVVS